MIDTDSLLRRLEEEGAELMRVVGERIPVFADVLESDDEVLVLVDLPGCEKHSLDLTYDESGAGGEEGGVLNIEARREKDTPRAFQYVSEDRALFLDAELPLPPDADGDDAAASMRRGVLEVRLPKRDAAGERTIPVTDAESGPTAAEDADA